MEIGIRKASKIAKRYVSGLITNGDGFHSDLLTDEENELVQQECLKIAFQLFDGKEESNTNEIVREIINN